MKNKKKDKENYLDKIPVVKSGLSKSVSNDGMITLEIENKGVFNKFFQLVLKKPKITYIHLDETGSFVWPLIDGKRSIAEIGKEVDSHFGEAAHPLYERLAKFFQILDSYGFVEWK